MTGVPDTERTHDRATKPLVTFFDEEVRKCVDSLYANRSYDMRDIANALLGLYGVGALSFEVVDAVFVSEGWPWPGSERAA